MSIAQLSIIVYNILKLNREGMKMTNISLKDQMQQKADWWISRIQALTAELNECEQNGKPFEYGRALNEYKGRIYATRSFAEMIGIELNTDF